MAKFLIGVPLYLNITGVNRTICVDGDFELICLNDAQNHDSVDLLKNKDKRISVHPGARTGNPIDNWNLTLDRMAEQKDVSRCILMHHDEALIADIPKCEIRALASNEIGILQHRNGIKKVLSNRAKCIIMNRFPNIIRQFNYIGPVGLLVLPTQLQHRFENRLRWYVDTEFYYTLSNNFKFVPIQCGLVTTFENVDSITNKLSNIDIIASEERKTLGIKSSNTKIKLLKMMYHIFRKVFGRNF